LSLHLQFSCLLAGIAHERGDPDVALDFADRALRTAREEYATEPEAVHDFATVLKVAGNILGSLGRVGEALHLDLEWLELNPGRHNEYPEAFVRVCLAYIAQGTDPEAEEMLRDLVQDIPEEWDKSLTRKRVEDFVRPHVVLAELLERRGTEEALAEARTLRDGVAQQLAVHEARRAAALEETRAAAAEAVRQWREERIIARGKKKGATGQGKKKSKKKGRGKSKGASCAAAIEGKPPREPAGGEAKAAAALEGAAAAAAEAEQQAPVGEAQPHEEEEAEEEETREECAICLQDLELEDDEGGEGEALVVLRCGHRFHAICGDMWCAKCADKGWGVTCPRCRAPYAVVQARVLL
jgi:tetratricopeptide (TPR) repeat protein